MSRGIETTINNTHHTLDVEHTKTASIVVSDSCSRSIHLGCGSQGSCGSCVVIVNGKPRMSCTMRAKNLHNKNVRTVESLPETFARRFEQTFMAMGATQCGFCLPGIAMQIYNLSEQLKDITLEHIQKALHMHSCRCMSPEIITDAIFAFLDESIAGDGWVPLARRQPILGKKQILSEFQPPNLKLARPIIGNKLDTLDNLAPLLELLESQASLVLRTDHEEADIFQQNLNLQGFIVGNDEWTIHQIESGINIQPLMFSNPSQDTSQVVLDYKDAAPLETEICTIVDNAIHIQSLEQFPTDTIPEGYTIQQWSAGGSFGHRTWNEHIHWALWLTKILGTPISVRPTMAQMLVLRPKVPRVSLSVDVRVQPPLLCIETEHRSELKRWNQDLQNHLRMLLNPLTSENELQVQFNQAPASELSLQYSYSRIVQASSMVIGLIQREFAQKKGFAHWQHAEWFRLFYPKSMTSDVWMRTLEQYVSLKGTGEHHQTGIGIGVTPAQISHLERPLTCTIRIIRHDHIVIESPISESDGFLSSALMLQVNRETQIPLDCLVYQTVGTHPDSTKDPDIIRLHCQQLIDMCIADLNQQGLSDSIGTCFTHTSQTIEIPENGCGVVVSTNEQNQLTNCWVYMEIGRHASLFNVRSELSGRWMRSLSRERLFAKDGTLSTLFKDTGTLKAKQQPKMHWMLSDSESAFLPWMGIDGATIAAVLDTAP